MRWGGKGSCQSLWAGSVLPLVVAASCYSEAPTQSTLPSTQPQSAYVSGPPGGAMDPGYGYSQGTPSEQSCIEAARTAYKWLTEQQKVAPGRILPPILGPGELANVTIATGHYRNGILLTPITAKLVREWITEQRVSIDWDLFSPLRFRQPAEAPEPEVPETRSP